MLIKKKKYLKRKIFNISFIKKAIVEIKHPAINDHVNDFIYVIGFIFFQNIKNQAKYKDRILAHDYYFFLIFYDFN